MTNATNHGSIDLGDLLSSIETGDRPSRSVTAALLLELRRLGVESVPALPPRALYQAAAHHEPLVQALAHLAAGERWCSWHRRWEPPGAFGGRDPRRGLCTDGATEQRQLLPDRCAP